MIPDDVVYELFKKEEDYSFLNNCLIEMKKEGFNIENDDDFQLLIMKIYPTILRDDEIDFFISSFEKGVEYFDVEVRMERQDKRIEYAQTKMAIKRP